jgi:multicomponent Na+:H+ antiporter subunit B
MNKRVVILESIAPALYWTILAASIWVLLRGHNEPGGGFIGGLIAVSASVLWSIAFNADAAERRLPLRSAVTLATVGIAIGVASGIPALWLGNSFLTHIWGAIPVVDIKVSTVLIFDLGVYLAVWGALAGYALSLLALGEDDEGGHATEEGRA